MYGAFPLLSQSLNKNTTVSISATQTPQGISKACLCSSTPQWHTSHRHTGVPAAAYLRVAHVKSKALRGSATEARLLQPFPTQRPLATEKTESQTRPPGWISKSSLRVAIFALKRLRPHSSAVSAPSVIL